ncbi:hypothetical protein [Streptomyces sp. NBC_00649]
MLGWVVDLVLAAVVTGLEAAAEVRAALLAINGPDVPYAVRNGTPAGVPTSSPSGGSWSRPGAPSSPGVG